MAKKALLAKSQLGVDRKSIRHEYAQEIVLENSQRLSSIEAYSNSLGIVYNCLRIAISNKYTFL